MFTKEEERALDILEKTTEKNSNQDREIYRDINRDT